MLMSNPQDPAPPELPLPDAAAPVPPAEVETEEGLGQKRSKRTFWQRVGGEGFMVSVGIHVLLVLIAAFLIISVSKESAKKDPNSFSTGSGGGAAGDKAKQFKTRLQPKNPKTTAKTPTRITSKSTTATIALPDVPTVAVSSMNAGLMGGGSSKGFGGGSGGGIGSGMGVGRGNGKNFVSVFGSKMAVNGLPGTFYDFKQNKSGKPTPMMGGAPEKFGDPSNSAAIGLYVKEVNEFFDKGFSPSALNDVFRAPDTLLASQIFIPPCPATEAPKAYGVGELCKPSRWIAHYKGAVKPPQGGKFRFVGSGDDFLVIRWDRKVVLDSGYGQYVVGNENIYPGFGKKPFDETHPSKLGKPLRCGPWITATKDKETPLEIVIGETPGGTFYAIVLIEVADASGKPDGHLRLFRMTTDELPDAIKNGHPSVPGVDMTGGDWIFKPVKTSVTR
jgi:hypothetical protein